MPPAAGLFDGCTDRESAVSHIAEAGFSAADLVFDITWPVSKEVVIQVSIHSQKRHSPRSCPIHHHPMTSLQFLATVSPWKLRARDDSLSMLAFTHDDY